jgi:hypothetical protein
MNKRLVAILLTAALTSVSVAPAFAAEDDTERITIDVKEGEAVTREIGNVDFVRGADDRHWAGVYVRSDGAEVELKTGDITGSGDNEVTGVYAFSKHEGKADVSTGSVNTNGVGIRSAGSTGGNTAVAVNGGINSVGCGVNVAATDENTRAVASVEGDVNVAAETNYPAVYAQAYDGSEVGVTIAGDVNSAGDGPTASASSGGNVSVRVTGNVTSSGTAIPREEEDILTTAVAEADGEGSIAEIFISGNVTMNNNNNSSAIMLKSFHGGKASMKVDGTVRGGDIPVRILASGSDLSNISLTVWKIEPNDNGFMTRIYDNDTNGSEIGSERTEAFEKTINYIIKLEEDPNARLRAQDTAHEGDKVILKVDVKDGYELTGAYNGVDGKVPLVKDTNGDWYVIVPKGGGIYLSVELKKKEESNNNNDKKDDNNNIVKSVSTGTYATAEAFSAAAVSMIASAAPGSTVTIDATSFTSLPASIVAALMARPDVTFVFTYMLNGIMYKVTIPAGTNLAGLLNASCGIDFASLVAYTSVAA